MTKRVTLRKKDLIRRISTNRNKLDVGVVEHHAKASSGARRAPRRVKKYPLLGIRDLKGTYENRCANTPGT
jgi:hypothetical protein